MESERRSSMRRNRKTLSDCTNTIATTRRNPSSPGGKSSAIIEPRKSTDSAKTTKPKPPASSSLNSYTSTGSNNSTNTSIVPPTPLFDDGDRDRRKSGFPAAQHLRQDGKTRKDKGKVVLEIQASDLLISNALEMSSSATSGNYCLSGIPTVESQKPDERTKKDKGTMVVETPYTEAYGPSTPHALVISPSTASGERDRGKSGFPAAQHLRQDAKTRKDKGKMVLEIQASDLLTSQALQISSSAASGSYCLSGIPAVQSQKPDAQTRKDKGKMVLETPNTEATRKDKGKMVLETPDVEATRKDKGKIVLETPDVEATRKDKGKMVLETPDVEVTRKDKGKMVLETPDIEVTRKDKGKMVLETPGFEASGSSTPHALVISSSDASGTHGEERPDFMTVYDQRRASQRRKITVTLSCPPDRRVTRKRVKLDDDGCHNRPGSQTDPLPVEKKKRSRKKLQDEIEKLKAYYAEIDAFELPEEVVSDVD